MRPLDDVSAESRPSSNVESFGEGAHRQDVELTLFSQPDCFGQHGAKAGYHRLAINTQIERVEPEMKHAALPAGGAQPPLRLANPGRDRDESPDPVARQPKHAPGDVP